MTQAPIRTRSTLDSRLNERLLSNVVSHSADCLPKSNSVVTKNCESHTAQKSAGDAHEVDQLARTLTLALFQVLAGERSPTQMSTWFAWNSYQRFEQHYGYVTRHRMRKEQQGLKTPHYRRAHVIAARQSRINAKTYEVSIVIRDAVRVRAVAMQLKSIRKRWRITELVIG